MIFADLVANLALLVACGSIYGLLAYRRNTSNTRTRIFAGILFGAVAVIGMMTPFVYAPGIIFDGRSVLLSIAGLFAGPITAGIAAAIAIAYRLWLGGGGALPGVAVIITSALFGVALYYKSKKQPHLVAAWQIYTLGIVVHVSMLLWMICLPGSAPAVLSTISLPIMVGFPLATLLLGSLLSNMERRFFAEAQLKASSDQYSDIIHAQTEMVDRWFPDGTLTFVNDAYCTFYGHTSEELLGRNWLGFVASEDREKLENYVQQLIPSLTPDQPVQTSEHREVDAGGEIRWTRWIDRGIFNDKDILEQIQSTGQDITERKQAQEQLRDREQRLSSIFKASPTGIGVVIDRVFVTVNDHFCHMTGYSEEELIGQSTRMVYPTDEDYTEVGRVKYEQIATHGVGTVETRFLCKDGRIINIILSSAPFDPEDLSSGVTFTALEVTERKQTEEALRLTQFSVDQSADAVYWMGQNAEFIYVNDAAVKMLGYSKEELLT
ncbi:PAS domain S-box protein, partial [Candidatus Bipolaricaulota bacterium]|nr:PAS domain S-box protein [Candidatus Bipolaricaulota bacterium]